MIKTLRKLKWFLYLKYVKKLQNLNLSVFPVIGKDAKIIIKQRAQITWGKKNILDEFVVVRADKGKIIFHNDVRLKRFVELSINNGKIEIGSNTRIHNFSIIQSGEGGLTIGDHVRIASFSKIFAANHNFHCSEIPIHEQGISSKGIKIGSNVWIGTGAIILDGIEIGDNVIIAAGSVVTRSIGSNSLAAGNPAKVIRKIFEVGNKQKEHNEI